VTDATADAMQTASVGTQISAVNSRISGFEGTTAGLNGYVMYRSVTTAATADLACTSAKLIDWTAMGLASATKDFTTCTISLTATNTQSAATKAFT
jgi:hypothetical protein